MFIPALKLTKWKFLLHRSEVTYDLLLVNFYYYFWNMLSFCFQRQLERFVPFMLQCSLGQKFLDKYTPPPKWWPEDLPFSIHVKKPVGMHDVSTLGVYKSVRS